MKPLITNNDLLNFSVSCWGLNGIIKRQQTTKKTFSNKKKEAHEKNHHLISHDNWLQSPWGWNGTNTKNNNEILFFACCISFSFHCIVCFEQWETRWRTKVLKKITKKK